MWLFYNEDHWVQQNETGNVSNEGPHKKLQTF